MPGGCWWQKHVLATRERDTGRYMLVAAVGGALGLHIAPFAGSHAGGPSMARLAKVRGGLSEPPIMSDVVEEEFKVLALANASAEYAFEILELAYEPEIKAEPNRASFAIFGFFAAAFTFCAGILFREL